MPPGPVYAFGPFQLDSAARELTRASERLRVPDRHLSVLVYLLEHPGALATKDAIIAAAWNDVAVTDNSLEQAISALRRLLGNRPEGDPYLETVPRRGYRFTGDVTRLAPRTSDAALDALLAPHRQWIEGRAALETLVSDQIAHARDVFDHVVRHAPDQAPPHIGMANACVMQFETTRTDAQPDMASLEIARVHAQDACRLDPDSAEAWATLGFVLDRTGPHTDALAASRRATMLEPDNWRHHVRLASVAWGEERLRAARRTLALLPGFPLAHWLAATVLIARQALDEAERELVAGAASREHQATSAARFSGVALHWLLGLIAAARGDQGRALTELARELAFEPAGHMYARECCAHTWHALGAIRLHEGDLAAAERSFGEAIARVPAHPMAHIGRAAARGELATLLSAPPTPMSPFEARGGVEIALAHAAALVLARRPAEAAALVSATMAQAPGANVAWLLPIDPLLRVQDHPDIWSPVLSRLRARAA